ncbi:MAG: hypothetical protein K940chlam7_00124 [Chlamydiae bacterium]|nr:hypothetical protein [Chlamydiota bacterium]
MKKINLRRLQYCSLLLFVFFHFCTVFGDSGGTFILLNGTSCAGKSTLAAKLVEEFPGDFVIVKKTSYVKEKKVQLIQNITGKTPYDYHDMNVWWHSLSISRELEQMIEKEAFQVTMEKIKRKLKYGKNVIFDVTVKDLESFDPPDECNVLTVLVYAPLSVIAEREQQRAIKLPRDTLTRQRSKKAILGAFSALYSPVKDDAEDFIGIVHRKDIFDRYDVPEKELVYLPFKKAVWNTLKKFNLLSKEQVKIAPTQKHDLFIDSSKLTPEESANLVAQRLKVPFAKPTDTVSRVF